MKILVLAPHPFFQHRGTPIAVLLLAEVLAGAGHEIDLLTYHEGQDVDIAGVTIHRISGPAWVKGIPPGPSWKKALCDLYMWRAAKRLAGQGGYDLAHAVEEAAFMALGLKRRLGLPFVYDMDSSLAQQMAERYKWLRPLVGPMQALERRAVCASQGVVAVCQALGDLACEYSPQRQVVCLEDISLLQVESLAEPAPPPPLGIAGQLVMYVGNLERYQGVDLMLDAFALAAPQAPQAHLVVIGGSPAQVARYSRQAQDMGLAGRAHFLGPRPPGQLGHLLPQARVLVSPRLLGGNTPMKIYSYLDSGRPLLATRLPTHTQVLDDSLALLCEPTPQAMAQGLLRLLEDEALGHRLAQAARQRVARDYSYPVYKRKLLDFYQALERDLAQAGPGSA